MDEGSTGKDIKPYQPWVEGQDKVTSQARRPTVWEKIKSMISPGSPKIEQPTIQKPHPILGARPMTTKEHLEVTRDVMHDEPDAAKRAELSKQAVGLRNKVEREQRANFRKKATLAAAPFVAAAAVASSPVGEAVGQQANRIFNSPESTIVQGIEQAAKDNSSRGRDQARGVVLEKGPSR